MGSPIQRDVFAFPFCRWLDPCNPPRDRLYMADASPILPPTTRSPWSERPCPCCRRRSMPRAATDPLARPPAATVPFVLSPSAIRFLPRPRLHAIGVIERPSSRQ
uniref:Uncharacterized protein n=1 Tax=Octopus bimaculoides TaxID=37653 RepID=A0A0L8IBU0_OCTBM